MGMYICWDIDFFILYLAEAVFKCVYYSYDCLSAGH